MQTVNVKEESIVLLNGAMGTGKSTLCEKLFDPHHIVSTDRQRQEFCGDFNDMRYNDEVFEIVFCMIEQRLKAGVFTVVDSTASNSMVNRVAQLAAKYGRQVTVLRMPELTEDQLTEERMQHRMSFLHVYHRQVERCRNQTFPNSFDVVDVEDPDNIEVKVISNFAVDLPLGYEYTVVGDVHGEYHLILKLLDEQKIDKLIFLGDIVDRGRSSYMAFRLISDMVNDGRAHMVPGNHDNKLMRYFKKWLKDENPNKYKLPDSMETIPTYGMTLAHGLSGTLMEFYQMKTRKMERYAEDFIQFYNQLPPYLRLEFDQSVHIFAHAGATKNIIEGKPLTKNDLSGVLYRTMNLADYLEMDLDLGGKFYTIHLGHEVVDPPERLQIRRPEHDLTVYKHDLGMGKTKVNTLTGRLVCVRT